MHKSGNSGETKKDIWRRNRKNYRTMLHKLANYFRYVTLLNINVHFKP